jgi:hypothetical protein
MSFRDVVYAWRDGAIYQRIIKPTAEFCTALVSRIAAFFLGK